MINFITGRNLFILSSIFTLSYILTYSTVEPSFTSSTIDSSIMTDPSVITSSNISTELIRKLDIEHKCPIVWVSEGVEYTWLEPSEFPKEMNKLAYNIHAKAVVELNKSGTGSLRELCEPGRVLLKYPIIQNKIGYFTVDPTTGFHIIFTEK